MKPSNDLSTKIANLEEEVNSLKASQVLSGSNSVVYHKYIEVESVWVRYGGGPSGTFNNQYWFSEDGSSGSSTSSLIISAMDDDPFEILGIEKMEVWRNDKLLTGWSGYIEYNNRGFGQRSSLGDLLHIETGRSVAIYQTGWLVDSMNRLGPFIKIQMQGGPSGSLTDNPATPFRYKFKLWVKSTNPSEYQKVASF